MQVFIRVNGELRQYVAAGISHQSAIQAVTDVVMQELRGSGSRSIALAVIEGGKGEK